MKVSKTGPVCYHSACGNKYPWKKIYDTTRISGQQQYATLKKTAASSFGQEKEDNWWR
jgi:hypothetical protein